MFQALDNLVRMLATLPGIGERSALRIAFSLLKSDENRAEELARAVSELRRTVRFCGLCGGLSEGDLCSICQDPDRDRSLLAVVEEPGDVFAIEKTREFSGRYHVLMGALSPLDGIGPEDLRLDELFRRLADPAEGVTEVFIATNPTLEGDATGHFIRERVPRPEIRFTRISHGIPTGASIEYADQSTLARSIRTRQDIGRD